MMRTARAMPALYACAALSLGCLKPEPDRLEALDAQPAPLFSAARPDAGPQASPAAFRSPDASAREQKEIPDYARAAFAVPRIVLFGDSIVHYSDGLVPRTIASDINSGRDGGAPATALGVTKGGQLISGWIGSQFDKYVADPRFNIIVLQGGVNDLGWWGKLKDSPLREKSFQDLVAKLEGMVNRAVSEKKVIVLVSVSPWKGAAYWSEDAQRNTWRLNSWMSSKAELPGIYFADTYTALQSACENGALERGYRGYDVQHPNDEGKRAIADVITRSLGLYSGPITPPAREYTCAP